MNLSRTQEDYLHVIYELVQEQGFARLKDINDRLGVKASSANSMVRKLESLGFVTYKKNSPIMLTADGKSRAKIVKTKHETFIKFFEILSLPQTIAEKDALKIEHNLHPETIHRMKCFIDFLERSPQAKTFQTEFQKYCHLD